MTEQDPNALRARIREFEKYVASRDANWQYEGEPLSEIEKELNWKISEEIRKRLEASEGKLVVLDGGCGHEPTALNDLAKMFKREMKEGRLELHGLNLSKKAPNVRVNEHGVHIHNTSPRNFFKKGINPHVIFDHLGSIYHASTSGTPVMAHIYLTGLSKTLSPGGEFRFNVRRYGNNIPTVTVRNPNVKITDTGHSGLYFTHEQGSEMLFSTRVFKMKRRL